MKTTRKLVGLASLLLTTCARAQQPAPAPISAPHSTNARDYYLAAEKSLDKSTIGFYSKIDINFAPGSAAQSSSALNRAHHILSANQRALNLIRAGMQFAYHAPPDLFGSGNGRDFGVMRTFLYLLVLDAHRDAAAGNWSGCANCGIEAIRVAFDFSRTDDPAAVLTAPAMEKAGQEAVYASLPHLGAGAAQIARNLGRMELYRASPADFQQAQEDALLAQFADLQAEADKHPGAKPTQSELDSMHDFQKQYKRLMDALVANERLPYAQPKPPIAGPTNRQVRQIYTTYSHSVLPNCNTAMGFLYANSVATGRILLVQLALGAFRASTGHYPDTLAELVPALLPAVPADPFALDQPLRYKTTKNGYLLYSLGPDCTDNGGNPIVKSTAKGPSHFVTFDSKGDIVAGINTR